MGSESYTLGEHQLLLGAYDVGHVASAKVTITTKPLSHYVAAEGGIVEDDAITASIAMDIEAALDEMNMANLRLFFMADGTGKVGAMHNRRSAVTLKGVVIDGCGTPFTWAIPDAFIKPSGELSYSPDSWSTFGLRIRVRPSRASANPFGVLT